MDYQIVYKSDSRLMRWIGRIWPAYLHQVVTTYGGRIYLPTTWNQWPESHRFLVLEHEKVHLRQQERIPGPLFLFLYLFVLPVFWTPFRRQWEREAFEETIEIAAKKYGPAFVQDPQFREFIARQFYTGTYGWMWPNKRAVYRWLDACIQKSLKSRPS